MASMHGVRAARRQVASCDFTGTLVLVGAGKMGGAMLEGWLALGLDPKKVAIQEPQPAPEIAALAARGVRINPAVGRRRVA